MLTVHVGLHKTGSTSIQVALRRALKTSASVPQEGDSPNDEAVFDRLVRASESARVISSESLLGSPFDGYARLPERVRLLSDALGGKPYTLVAYLRPHLRWFESVYIQYVQGGGTEAPDDLVGRMLVSPYLRWRVLLDALIAGSGAERILIRAYSSHRDVVGDFFSVAELGRPPSGRRTPRQNPSLTASQVPLMRALNCAHSVSRAQRQRIRGVLQRMALGSQESLSALPEELQLQIVREFRDDWVSLADVPVCSSDRERFARTADVDDRLRPYAGSSVEDAVGRDELARVLFDLAESYEIRDRSLRAKLNRWTVSR